MRKKKREPYGSRLWGTEKFKRFLGGGEKRDSNFFLESDGLFPFLFFRI